MTMPITVLDGATRLPAQRYLRRGVEAICLNDYLATGLVGLKGGRGPPPSFNVDHPYIIRTVLDIGAEVRSSFCAQFTPIIIG